MLPTEYVVHEHRKELERTAAEIRLVREAATQPNRLLTTLFNVVRMFRLRRPQSIMQPVVWQAVRRAS